MTDGVHEPDERMIAANRVGPPSVWWSMEWSTNRKIAACRAGFVQRLATRLPPPRPLPRTRRANDALKIYTSLDDKPRLPSCKTTWP